MSKIDIDDIIGFKKHNGDYHWECYDGDIEAVSRDNIITMDEVDDSNAWYYCDKCKKRIPRIVPSKPISI